MPIKRIVVLFTLFLFSCSPEVQVIREGFIADGKYDTEFPNRPAGDALSEIVQSVKLISSMTFYESFTFSKENPLLKSELSKGLIEQKAITRSIFEQPAAGAGTLIYSRGKKAALITCAHIVNAPDTIITRFVSTDGKRLDLISSISIKVRQSLNVIGLPVGDEPFIIAADEKNDLAIIGKNFKEKPLPQLPVFDYPWGSAAQLDWGSFVYLIGYPHGKQVLSKALVSNPNRSGDHSFVIDGTLFRGVSGGIILAIRDGVPNFELVGIANALSAESQYVLKPDLENMMTEPDLKMPYKGEILIDSYISVAHGITFAISREMISAFLYENKKTIEDNGVFLDRSYYQLAD